MCNKPGNRHRKINKPRRRSTHHLLADSGQKKDPLAAFEHLSQHPLTHLGVAFGTKYLYFCSAAVRESHAGRTAIAPVLDAVVRQWLTAHTELRRLHIDRWDVKDYRRYFEALSDWSEQLELPMDRIEELIFRWQVTQNGSRFYSESWATTSTATRDAAEAMQQLHLALAELSGGSDLAEKAQPHIEAIAALIARGGAPT